MIWLFILSLFSFDRCEIEVDSITLAKQEWLFDTKLLKVFFIEGELVIDNKIYNKAVIRHTVQKIPPRYYTLEISKIYFGYDNEEDTVNQEFFYCKGREANSYKDIEKILACACKHSGFYYWFSPVLHKYIEYNSQYNYRR